jgi:hypothetical protein
MGGQKAKTQRYLAEKHLNIQKIYVHTNCTVMIIS